MKKLLVVFVAVFFGCNKDTSTPSSSPPPQQAHYLLGTVQGGTSGEWSPVMSYKDTGIYLLTIAGFNFSNSNVSEVTYEIGFDTCYYNPGLIYLDVWYPIRNIGSSGTLLMLIKS